MVIVDRFFKREKFIPLKKVSAKAVADPFFDNLFSKYGTQLKLMSDNGHCFVSDILKALCAKLEISHVITVLYRPQSNMPARGNQILIQMNSS